MRAQTAMIFEYVINLNRPFARRRFWRMGILASRHNGGGDEYIAAVAAEGQRELKRKAEAAWRQAGANGTCVLTLLEEPSSYQRDGAQCGMSHGA